MNACPITKAIAAQSCDEQDMVAGNTVTMYLTSISKTNGLSAFTVANGAMSNLTFAGGAGLIPVEARKEGITDNSSTAGGEAGAGKVQTQNVLISFGKLGKDYREAIQEIMKSQKLVAIVRSNADEFKVFGIFDYLDTSLIKSKGLMATYETDSGILFTDAINQTLTLTGESKYYAGMLFSTGTAAQTQTTIDGLIYDPSSASA